MSEIIPRIGANRMVELVDERNVKIEGLSDLTAEDAAFLGRALLACSATLVELHPKVGELVADTHLPIARWIAKLAAETGRPVLILEIPPSEIQLTFELHPQRMKELGQALVDRGEGRAPPVLRGSGTVH